MSIGQWCVTAWVVVTTGIWLLNFALTQLMVRRIRRLKDVDPPEPKRWPKLSIVIPACNEADTLEASIRTLLDQDYPEFELVVIDDRSTDGTSGIVDRLAAADSRIRAIHITELPEGWLGKVNALQQGVAAATGEWVLFTDADLEFEQGILRRSVAWSEHEDLDHLVMIPEFESANVFVGVGISAAIRGIVLSQRPWKAQDPNSDAALGSGGFNLVRRTAFGRTPGFEWLRLEVADDIGLGLMMKRFGGKLGLVAGTGLLRVR